MRRPLEQDNTPTQKDLSPVRPPEELASLERWIRWDHKATTGGKKTKIPLTVDGRPGSTTDPSTWTTYDNVKDFPKIGFVFVEGDGLIGIDLDHVIQGKILAGWARDIIESAKSYCEFSPSHEGLHIIGRGKKPAWLPNRVDMPNEAGLEVYTQGRYFTFTGEVFENHSAISLIDCENVFSFLRERFEEKPKRGAIFQISRGPRYSVSVHSIVPGLKEETNTTHPFHDSTTGANFRVDKGGETWRCWRHGFTHNGLHLLGQKEGIIQCGEQPSKEQWRKILKLAEREGIVSGKSRAQTMLEKIAKGQWV